MKVITKKVDNVRSEGYVIFHKDLKYLSRENENLDVLPFVKYSNIKDDDTRLNIDLNKIRNVLENLFGTVNVTIILFVLVTDLEKN